MAGDNLELWRSVEATDPSHVKPITGKSYKGNSPKPYWIMRRATETFGPCGIGWGWTIINERIEEGVPIDNQADKYSAPERLSIVTVEVWYVWKGQTGRIQHVGGTPFSGYRKTSGDAYIDEDAVKKSVTDAIVKALSMLGFAGDIFMGKWDDCKYVQQVGEEYAEKAKDQRSEEEKAKAANIHAKGLAILKEAASKGTKQLELVWKGVVTPAMREACKADLQGLKARAAWHDEHQQAAAEDYQEVG